MRGVRQVIRVFQAIARPGWRGRAVASFFYGLLRLVGPRGRRIDSNLRLVYPEKDGEWRRAFRRRVYDGLAWTLTETLALQRDPGQAMDWVSPAEGEEVLDGLFNDGGGALILTGHIGNWELLGSWYAQTLRARLDRPLYVVYQEIHDADIAALVREYRERSGMSVLPKETSTLEIARLLREGAHIAILADVSWVGGVLLPFMGRPCTNSMGPSVLAMLASVPIIPLAIYREAPFRHRVRILPPLHLSREGDRHARLERMTLEINHALERLIDIQPELWFWLHNRWKIRGAPSS